MNIRVHEMWEDIKKLLFDKTLLPTSIRERPWERRTSFIVPFPPIKVAGNAQPQWLTMKTIYPLATDAKLRVIYNKYNHYVQTQLLAMYPISPINTWSIQSLKFVKWLPRVPCYFTMSLKIRNSLLRINFGAQPVITSSGWYVKFPKCSLTWNKIK